MGRAHPTWATDRPRATAAGTSARDSRRDRAAAVPAPVPPDGHWRRSAPPPGTPGPVAACDDVLAARSARFLGFIARLGLG